MNKVIPHDLSLLEYLAAKAGCMYLSDLHQPVYQYMLPRIIRQMDADAYSLTEWNDAVQYITGETKLFADKARAAEYLQSYEPMKETQTI